MKHIKKETIKNPERFISEQKMTKEVLQSAIDDAIKKTDKLWEDVGGNFVSEVSDKNVYFASADCGLSGWGTGFWTGILWLAYELTADEKYRERALSHVAPLYRRIDEKIGVNHHDMGFLYVPSCVGAYKLVGNEQGRDAALKAADHLLTRYIDNGGYIQAWGNVGEQPRLIIDCMNNIPLLYWAAQETGNSEYYTKAYNHARATIDNIVREDASTYHTFYFNEDGTPDRGTTAQGAGDDSCWARGQAWIVSGLPLSYKYTGDECMPELFEKVTNYFLNRLPEDYVPYWDLIYDDSSGEYKDSSAAAIAACGILEMLPHIKDEKLKAIYTGAVDKMMYSLYENYSTKDMPESNGLLAHAVYTVPGNYGIDECNIWGCYYYMEALARMTKISKAYW